MKLPRFAETLAGICGGFVVLRLRTYVRYPAGMLWRFVHETVEDSDGKLHRIGCRELADAAERDRHPEGSSIRCDVAPRECWSCRPELELVLGV